MSQPQDSETLKLQREGQTVSDFVKSDGWALAKRMLLEKIRLTDSLSTTIFENKTAEQISVELQSRANSVQLIKDWLSEVEGTAHQYESNNSQTNPEEELIVRF